MKYLDDEDTWVVLYSDMCVEEAFRCAKPILGTNFRRLKIKTFKDDTQEDERIKEQVGQDKETQRKTKFRNLCPAPKSTTITRQGPMYRTPIQILIEELEDSINVKKVELESATEHFK
jgi:hypothetical protein